MGERVRAMDWAATPLGPADTWPRSLRVALGICLNSRFPMFVWWGPDLINLYNDAYIPVLGKRHPDALGRPARATWEEIWPVVGPQADAVMRRGEATWNDRVLLVLERNGYTEDTYFTWSYSPIPDDSGGIGGLFCACTEETQRVRAEADRDRLLARLDDERSRLADLFQRSPSFMCVMRGPGHVFELANDRYFQLVGDRDVLGKPIRLALPELEGQGFFERLDRVFATGEPFVGKGLPVMLRRRAGGPLEERHVEFVYEPLCDAGGAVSGIFVHGFDVTDHRVAEQRLSLALAAARLGTWDWDPRTDVITLSDQAEAIFGLPAGARVTRSSLRDLLFEEDRARAAAANDRAISDRRDYDIEYRLKRPDGRPPAWVATTGRAQYDPSGNLVRMIGVVQDVTERKRAEEGLRGSEERYRFLAEAMPYVVFTAGPDGPLDYASERLAEYAGRPVDQAALGDAWKGLVHPDDLPETAVRWSRSLETGEDYAVEHRVRRADGEYRWFLVRATAMRGADGRVRKWFGTWIDVHDLKLAEQAVRASEERFRSAFAHAAVGMAITDLGGRFLQVNEAYTRITGYTEAELGSLGFAAVTHPDDRGRDREPIRRMLAGEIPSFVIEKRYVRKDGAAVWVQNSVSLVRDAQGRPASLVRLTEDITDRKQSREALAAAQERLELALGAAELGTFYCPLPLGKIVWNEKCKEHFFLPPDAEVDMDLFYSILHPDDRERTRQAVERAVFGRAAYDIEYRTVAADGRSRWVRATAAGSTTPAGRPTRFDGVTLDVTGRKPTSRSGSSCWPASGRPAARPSAPAG